MEPPTCLLPALAEFGKLLPSGDHEDDSRWEVVFENTEAAVQCAFKCWNALDTSTEYKGLRGVRTCLEELDLNGSFLPYSLERGDLQAGDIWNYAAVPAIVTMLQSAHLGSLQLLGGGDARFDLLGKAD